MRAGRCRAHAVIGLSVLAYIFYAMLIMWLEPDLGTRALLYEAASALFTVGSSLGITPMLGTSSKILLCTAMAGLTDENPDERGTNELNTDWIILGLSA